MLSDLLDEVALCILSYLDVPSLLSLAATSHHFKALVSEKTVWLDALENVRHKRPIPLAHWEQASRSASAGVPLERLRNAVIRAAKIERTWANDVIRPTRFEQRRGAAGPPEDFDQLQCVYNLGFCGITLVYTVNRWCTCLFNETGETVRFQTRTHAACFDFDVDSEGITLVFNATEDEEVINLEIHRVEFQGSVHRLIKDIPTGGHCHSNFFEEDLAGCVLSGVGTPTYQMIAVNWRTGKYAVIDTKIELHRHITVSATKKQVLIGSEGIGIMEAWFYDLECLRRCVAQASFPEPFITSLAPEESRQILYIDQGVPPRWGPASLYPTSRGMWTGKHCFITKYVSWAGRDSFTYALIPDEITGSKLSFESDDEAEADGQYSFAADTTSRRTRFLSHKSFIYHLPDGSRLSDGVGFHYLYDIGLQGKNALWVERRIMQDGESEYACRLATFNHENEDESGPVSEAVSTIVFEHEGFQWGNIRDIQLDDNSGVLTCFTDVDIWTLYFD